MLVTDWDNVGRTVWEQRVRADITEASARAVQAGNDLIMTTPTFREGAVAAVERGQLDIAAIDDSVRRILRLKFDLGLFENPRAPNLVRQAEVIGCPAHRELNLEVARRALVLLRNDGTLPLAGGLSRTDGHRRAAPSGPPRTVAVIGPNAHDPQAMLGDWAGGSGQVSWMPEGHPRETVDTVLDGLRALVPDEWTVTHSLGADIGALIADPRGGNLPDGQPRPPVLLAAEPSAELLGEAVEAARAADFAIVVLGDNIALTGKGRSTATHLSWSVVRSHSWTRSVTSTPRWSSS